MPKCSYFHQFHKLYRAKKIFLRKRKKRRKMNADEFRIKGKEMVDYIADYLENIK